MKRFSKKINKKKVISKNKKLIGGWNNQKYYNANNSAKLTNDNAIQIGKFLINDELDRYFLNDDTYYVNPALNNKHTDDENIRRLKIELIKRKFKTDNDYLWLGNQFYFILGKSNPFHTIHNNGQGYSTWDDGVAFFDWLTNTPAKPPRISMILPIPSSHKNPLKMNYYKYVKSLYHMLDEHLPLHYRNI